MFAAVVVDVVVVVAAVAAAADVRPHEVRRVGGYVTHCHSAKTDFFFCNKKT